MYRVVLHPSAEKELEYATFFYENCSEGLGDDFLEGYIHCLSLIESTPFPQWEWADFDRNKLYWATGGKLFLGRLNSNGLFELL